MRALHHSPNRQHAFTLIELLIALAIFAIMALMSYRTLDTLFQTRTQLNSEASKLRDVALLFARLDDDFASLLDRRVRTVDNLLDDSLRLTALLPGANDATLVFTRGGFAGSSGETAAPQRIGYRLREGKFELLIWPSLDAAPRTAPEAHVALNDIRDARWRALDRAGNWQNVWRTTPVGDSIRPGAYPLALELVLTLASGEEYRRVFALRERSADAPGA